jgi:uncharacterized protein
VNERKREHRLPSRQQALNLLAQAGCSGGVIRHCKAVAALATELAKECRETGCDVDVELVELGALLHDIGRSKTHSVHHVVAGVEIAEALNLPKSVVSIIACHVGGGITREEAKRMGWKPRSYIPQTLEEKIVSYADLLIERSRRVPIEKTLKRFSRTLPPDAIGRMRKLHEEVQSLLRDCDANTHVA